MNGNLKKQIMSLLLALVLLMSNVPATAFATEETESTQPAAEAMSRVVQTELGATIEQQVRAFAKSINKTDADDDAAAAIAKHGITGGGKKLAVGKNHALTATLMNSELGLATVIQGCELGIQQMQQLNLSEAFVLSGTYWGSNPLNFFNIIYPEILEKNTPSNTLQICHAEEKKFTGETNGYDSSLGWIAGSANARTTITKAKVTADTVTYNVTVSFEDRFDFSTSSNSGFKNLISGLGALLFKEFDWTATATFSLTVDNGCSHDTDAYYWFYDAGTQSMASVTTDEFGENQTKKYTVTKNGGSVFYYELDQMVTLLHNVPWELEYTVKKPGYFILSPTQDSQNACYEMALYYRTHFFIQNTERIEGIYKTHCYGYTFANLFNYAKDQLFTVRLENVIQADGSNMIYVSVYNHDLQQTVLEPLPMDDYYWMQGGVLTLQDDESRGLSGEDLRIKYIGNAKYPFDSEIFELKVWENGKNGESDSCFTDKLTKPTCSAKGYTTHTCALCGYSYKDTYTAKIPHTYGKWTVSKIATCTEEGEERRDCTNCDHYETRDVAALGHDITHHQAQVVTCTVIGWNAYDTCSRCDYSTYVEISATGHNYGAWIETKAPTCTATGTERRDCNVCDRFETCDIAALGHDKVAHTAKAPTCTETGWEAYETCSRCAYTTYEKIAATGHKHNAVVTAPTCLERGYTAHTSHCGDTYKDNYVDALGHSFTNYKSNNNATCAVDGTETTKCDRCDATDTRTEEGSALGHNVGAWYVTEKPTCTETGTQRKDCSRCDHFEAEAIAATGHDHVAVVIAPTCLNQGYTTHTCHCGDSYKDSYVNALGHSFTLYKSNNDATCTADGTETAKCDRCIVTDTRVKQNSAKGHDEIAHKAKAPTCTEIGWDGYVTCARCNYTTYKEIAATGHSYTITVVEPTFADEGYTLHTCHCGDSYRTDYTDVLIMSALNVAIKADAAGKQTLSWNRIGDGVVYEIYRATKKTGTYTKVATVEGITWTDTTSAGGTTYYYKVKAVYEAKPEIASDFTNAVSLVGKSTAPAIAVENDAKGKPYISWAKVNGAKKYTVYRATSETGKYSKLGTTTKTYYTDSKAKAGTTYFYKVIANASSSKYSSGYSNIVSCPVICGTPSVTVKIDSNTGKPSLSWKKVDGVAKYAIYRQLPGEETFTLLAEQTALFYADKTAPIDTVCQYYVQTLGKTTDLNGAASKTVSATSGIAKPNVKGSVDAVSGKPVLSWEAVEGAVKYEVYRSTKSNKSYKLVATVETITYTDETVSAGKTYYYQVKAIGEVGKSANSSYDKLTGKCAVPVVTAANDSKGKPVISWSKISGAKKYTVYRATSETGKYTKLGTSTKTSYTDTKATPGSVYYYKVIANASSSKYNSSYSNIVNCGAYCGTPVVKVSNNSTGKVTLSWSKISGATKYEIYLLGADDYVTLGVVTGTSWTDTDAGIGEGRYYGVRAIAADENYNSEVSEPVFGRTICATPKITGKVGENKKPVITWGEVEGATKYIVYRSTSSSKNYKVIGEVVDGLSYEDLTAAKNKTYYYKVVAVGDGFQSAQSSYVKVKSK